MTGPSHPKPADLAAAYARKSTPDDHGVHDQYAICQAQAERDGHALLEHPDYRYGDDHTSGDTTSRTALDRLKRIIESGEAPFNVLYVKDLTRLGRFDDPQYHFYLAVHFGLHGVEVRPVDSAGEDPREPATFLRRAVESVYASEERKKIRKRIMTGVRQSLLAGHYTGPAYYATQRFFVDRESGGVLGPVDEHARIRPDGVRYTLRWREDGSPDVVRRIFEAYVGGESLQAIATRLTHEAIPTNCGHTTWSPTMVRRILANPLYMGEYVWGRTRTDQEPLPASSDRLVDEAPIRIKDYMPDPPVSRELFQRANELLERNSQETTKRKRKSPGYLLAGLLRCAECRATFHGHTSTKRYPTRRRYYRHSVVPRAYGGPCPHENRYLPAARVETPIETLVGDLLQDDQLREAAEAALASLVDEVRAGEIEDERRELERRQKTLEEQMGRLATALSERAEGAARRAIQSEFDALETEATDVERRRRELESEGQEAERLRSRLPAISESVAGLGERFGASDMATRQKVLAELLHEIRVDAGSEELEVEVVALE